MTDGAIQLLINTPMGKYSQRDDYALRRAALMLRIPYTTTMSAASAACDAVIALRSSPGDVLSLQERYERHLRPSEVA
jgi:carbamoyl-phosphate synthase large subunit